MSEIICKCDIPSDIFEPAGIRSENLGRVFNATKKYQGSIAELLLNNESTAIYHLNPENTFCLGDSVYIRPVLLGVNYHNGHSEGQHKIIVQNIPEKKGPWVIFRPLGSEERKFYLQNMIFPRTFPPEFQEESDAPAKILKRYLHKGNPLEIFSDFEKAGFKFVNEPMTEEYLEEVGY
ncbi:MAG: hypothetical protein MUP55_00800 [Candidatus Aenigmarchaeota archaeon]|nr:hypothetical protein [Candidatus Aenigmarchaeota archaeon]